jgi:membrane protein YqaA with SNARE-associated domain
MRRLSTGIAMDGWTQLDFAWACLWSFALALASAIFPWLTVEVLVLALPAIAPSTLALAALVCVATAGQMTGKGLVYWVGRTSTSTSTRVASSIDRWQARLTGGRTGPAMLVFLSSSVGVPPFFLVTAIAGAVRLSFSRFMLAGTLGRLLRFGLLVSASERLAWFHR